LDFVNFDGFRGFRFLDPPHCECKSPAALSRMGKTEVVFIQPCTTANLLTVDYAVWGALQQTIYHHEVST